MKKLFLCFMLFGNCQLQAQNVFKSINKESFKRIVDNRDKWQWRLNATIPAFKLIKSIDPNRIVDTYILSSSGGGISYQKLKINNKDRIESVLSISPLTILLSGNFSENSVIDISYLATVGFFNNLLMLGIGYDLGEVKNRSRIFGAISIGININNN